MKKVSEELEDLVFFKQYSGIQRRLVRMENQLKSEPHPRMINSPHAHHVHYSNIPDNNTNVPMNPNNNQNEQQSQHLNVNRPMNYNNKRININEQLHDYGQISNNNNNLNKEKILNNKINSINKNINELNDIDDNKQNSRKRNYVEMKDVTEIVNKKFEMLQEQLIDFKNINKTFQNDIGLTLIKQNNLLHEFAKCIKVGFVISLYISYI